MLAAEIEVEQNTPEWFSLRLGCVTASEMNSVFAKGRDGTSNSSAMYQNYLVRLATERVTGKPTNTYKSAAMQQGNDTEDLAALMYELKTGNILRKCGFLKHNELAFGASPDRAVKDKKILVQIKCPEPTEHEHTMRTKKIPPKYVKQCDTELGLSEYDELHFVSFNDDMPDNAKLVIIVITREERQEEYQKIEAKVKEFLEAVEKEEEFIKSYGRN